MSDFIFMPPEDFSPDQTEEDTFLHRQENREQLANLAMSLLEAPKASANVNGVASGPNSIIALRMPKALLNRLDSAAADAATNRSHLVRQMVADYLNSMEGQGIRFNGCLLSVDKA